MLALAILLLALVAALVVASFVGSSDDVVVEFANVTITSSVGGVFVTGVVAGLVALASLVALKVSISRRRQHNEEVRELRRRAEMATPATTTTVPDVRADPRPSDADTVRDEATTVAGDDTTTDAEATPPERHAGADDGPASDTPRT